ncbi:hypothetical protein BKI52_04560 [marine bacterium AO1-C]|nr:hypothetical protein BKI52_04560 [marine bacterium AO1-C]
MRNLKNLIFIFIVFNLTSFTGLYKTNDKLSQTARYFKIVNNTQQKVYLYVQNEGGASINALFKGALSEFRCLSGKKVYTASRGLKDRFLFEITSDMCGKKIKLSDYL